MGLSVTIGALLAGAACAGWTLSRFTVPGFARWVNLLGGVGILSLFLSMVSPNDGFRQELIRPATPSVRLSAHTGIAPRRSPVNLPATPFVEVEGVIRVPKTRRSFVRDQPLEFDTHLRAPIPIHSPPVAS